MDKLNIFKKSSKQVQTNSQEDLKAQLWQRVEYVISGLTSMGLKAVPLNTQEATELLYSLYNMGVEEKPTLPTEPKTEALKK